MVTPAEFEREWRTGDRARAREMAREYAEADRTRLDQWIFDAVQASRAGALVTREELVRLVDQYRELGDETARLLVEMILLVDYPPQRITGDIRIAGAAADAMAAVLAAEAIMGRNR